MFLAPYKRVSGDSEDDVSSLQATAQNEEQPRSAGESNAPQAEPRSPAPTGDGIEVRSLFQCE